MDSACLLPCGTTDVGFGHGGPVPSRACASGGGAPRPCRSPSPCAGSSGAAGGGPCRRRGGFWGFGGRGSANPGDAFLRHRAWRAARERPVAKCGGRCLEPGGSREQPRQTPLANTRREPTGPLRTEAGNPGSRCGITCGRVRRLALSADQRQFTLLRGNACPTRGGSRVARVEGSPKRKPGGRARAASAAPVPGRPALSRPRLRPLGWTGGPGPRALGGGSLQQCQPVLGWPPSPDPLQVSVSVSRARTRLCPGSSEQRCGRGVGYGNDWVRRLGLSWRQTAEFQARGLHLPRPCQDQASVSPRDAVSCRPARPGDSIWRRVRGSALNLACDERDGCAHPLLWAGTAPEVPRGWHSPRGSTHRSVALGALSCSYPSRHLPVFWEFPAFLTGHNGLSLSVFLDFEDQSQRSIPQGNADGGGVPGRAEQGLRCGWGAWPRTLSSDPVCSAWFGWRPRDLQAERPKPTSSRFKCLQM